MLSKNKEIENSVLLNLIYFSKQINNQKKITGSIGLFSVIFQNLQQ